MADESKARPQVEENTEQDRSRHRRTEVPRVEHENVQREAPTEGQVAVPRASERARAIVGDLADVPVTVADDAGGVLYPPKDDPSRPLESDNAGLTHRRDFVILPGPAGLVVTDCATAVCQEAIDLGYRPTGDAKVENITDHADGVHKVVTWAVPVADVKGPVTVDAAATQA